MPARFPTTALRTLTTRPTILQTSARRSFQTSARKLQDAAAPVAPAKKPVGGFRGSIFGFLLGSVLSGGAMYYYVVDEYKVSNELLTEDIYTLQSAVQRIEAYVKNLETEVKAPKK